MLGIDLSGRREFEEGKAEGVGAEYRIELGGAVNYIEGGLSVAGEREEGKGERCGGGYVGYVQDQWCSGL